jgi:hypothetical protein
MNQHLHERFPSRTLEAIKGLRRKETYKELVRELTISRLLAAVNLASEEPTPAYSRARDQFAEASRDDTKAAVSALAEDLSQQTGHQMPLLLDAAGLAVDGRDARPATMAWIRAHFPAPDQQPKETRIPSSSNKKGKPISKKRQRRREYARIQTLWKTDRRRAAQEILDGGQAQINHSLHDIEAHWRPICEAASHHSNRTWGKFAPTVLEAFKIWEPITIEEVRTARLKTGSAAGPDHITVRQWNAVPQQIIALLFNVFLLAHPPEELLTSRTVFIPKVATPTSPSHYRPISISSVILRHFNKVLCNRLKDLEMPDQRQRAFVAADGAAENVAVLDAVIATAHSSLREVHVATLDISKAFDSLSHVAVAGILRGRGLPDAFGDYITYLNSNSATVFQVRGAMSAPVQPGRGVRQGDPLSPALFNLAVDELLAGIPPEVGFGIEGSRVSCLAFADDLVIITSSKVGMQETLDALQRTAADLGLSFNPTKSSILSLIPDGKAKKMKVADGMSFQLAGEVLPHVSSVSSWRYLGITFDPRGLSTVELDVAVALGRLTKAPLKPQQRLVVLRTHLVPRLLHGLTLGNVSRGRLDQIDRQIRRAVRTWLKLPGDVPTAFFHASVADGGLGIPSILTAIPALTRARVARMELSSLPPARAAFGAQGCRRSSAGRRGCSPLSSSLQNQWPRTANVTGPPVSTHR